MTKTIRVVNLRKERYTLYIGRSGKGHSSKWGNPFKVGPDGSLAEVLKKYREYVLSTPKLLTSLHELDGQVLGCFCKPKPCHGDILVELRGRQRLGGSKVVSVFIDEPFTRQFIEGKFMGKDEH